MELAFPEKPFKTHGGAHVPHRKNTAQMESAVMPPPTQVIIPMQQHVGAPCTPLVKVGDEVLVGQKIADSMAFVSAPIHASVSGKVRAVTQVMLSGGQYEDLAGGTAAKSGYAGIVSSSSARIRTGWTGWRGVSSTCEIEGFTR